MPAILQRTVCVMSTDKENNKLEETKVSEKEEVKKVEANDVDNAAKEEKKDDDAAVDNDVEKEKEKVSKPSRKPAAKAKETKKKEEKSEDEEDDKDEDEDDEDDDKNSVDSPTKSEKDGKGVPLLDQPLQQSGTRQRKSVERLNVKDDNAPIDIPEGNGVALGSISVIEYNINKNKGDDLKKVHLLLFGRISKPTFIKKNIRKFNGFDFDEKSDEYEKKKAAMQKMELKALKEVSAILNLAAVGSRDELTSALMDFLMEPQAPSGPAKATTSLTKGGRPKRVAAARANDKGYSESEDEDDVKRTPRMRRQKGKRPNLKDESSSEDEREKKSDDDEDKASDEDMSVEETPSSDESDGDKSKKKRTPAKPAPKPAPKKPAAKKAAPAKKAEKKAAPPSKRKPQSEEEEEDSSEDDEPLVKKSKAPPTDEEIKTFVKGILEGANLEEITMKTVCKQVYAHYPDFDLAHKKDFIKSTVKSLIST